MLVLSTCSEYFEQIIRETQCKHPVIVLKDIRPEELEALLDYMYVGEVNVAQEKLSALLEAAEYLQIKGLAVMDEDPQTTQQQKRNRENPDDVLKGKRRKLSFEPDESLKKTPVNSKSPSISEANEESPSPRTRRSVVQNSHNDQSPGYAMENERSTIDVSTT